MMLLYHLSELIKKHLVDILGLFPAKNSDGLLKIFYDKLELVLLVLCVNILLEEPSND